MAKIPEGMEENMEVVPPTDEAVETLKKKDGQIDSEELKEYLDEQEGKGDILGSLYKEEGEGNWKDDNRSEAA